MPPSEIERFTVRDLARPTRLDRVLMELFPASGRRTIQSLVNAKKVRVNSRVVWLCSWQVKNGDVIGLTARPKEDAVAPPSGFDPAWLVANAGDVIAINKPAGLLSHAVRPGQTGDLLSLATAHFGPVILFHRLDRDTSGIMLLTSPGLVNRYLDEAFKKGDIVKEYLAVVGRAGRLEDRGVIDEPIGAHPRRREMMAVPGRNPRRAVTEYETLGEDGGCRLLRLRPRTGRTHQLRVHLAHMEAPILGDRLYGQASSAGRLLLHAWHLTLPELDGFPERRYAAPPPQDFLSNLPAPLRARLEEDGAPDRP